MDFALTQDQRLMQASVGAALDKLSPLERVRAFADSGEAVAADVWAGLTDLGAAGLLVPEEFGGLGLGLLDAALVSECLGARVAPTPFLGCALAALAIGRFGSVAQKRRWLPPLAAGEALAGVAIAEAVAGARDDAGVVCEAARLKGRSLFVLDAAGADVLLVADVDGGLHLVATEGPGVSRLSLGTIDRTRSIGEIAIDGAPAEPLDNPAALATVRDAAWVLLAADMLGASGTMLDKAVAYAGERRQFGRLIGSFQAVKHLCAEMAAELEPCRSLVWYAAYAFDAVPTEAPLMAAHAKAHLSEVSRFVARTATEVHGGIGITDLLGLHYWFKRVGLARQLLGGPERVRLEAARLQGLAA